MSKRARKKPASRALPGNGRSKDSDGLNGGSKESWKTTGRTLVLFREGTGTASMKTLRNVAGLSVATAADFEGGAAPDDFGGADGMVYPDLGVAVVNTPPQQIHVAAASESSQILAVEPERIVFAIEDGLGYEPMARAGTQAGPPLDFLRGYRDAVNHLYDKLTGNGAAELLAEGLAPVFGETEVTWGLQATKASASRFTGRDIRVAVLDTGLDTGHPDLVGRRITTQSFIQGESAQDGHGHGTHCVGTACGSRLPGVLPRYGVAFEADIFAGKVLSNQGSGGDGGILAGIQLGDHQSLRSRLHVTGRSDRGRPTLLDGVQRSWKSRSCSGNPDHCGGRKRKRASTAYRPGRASGELPVDHGCRRGGSSLPDCPLLLWRLESARRTG